MIAAGNQSTNEPTCPNAPTVAPDPRAITDAFLSQSLPLHELAQHFDISIAALIEILSTPEAQRQLETARQLADLQFHLLHQRAKAVALETLTEIATDPEADPTERRRAATAILRPRSLQRLLPSPPPSPTGEVPSAARRRGSPEPPNHPETLPPQTSPQSLIESSLATLANKKLAPKQALATIHSHFEPSATINDQPIPDDPNNFDKQIATDLSHCVQYFAEKTETNEATAHHRIVFVHRGGRCLYVDLNSAKQPDNTWLFTNITTEPIDSS